MSVPENDSVAQCVRESVAAFPAVQAAYLFGSFARERSGPLSDIDIAVLIEPDVPHREEIVGEIQDTLCRALRTDRIDLVDLNRSSPPLAYRVIRDGKQVFCRDPVARESFESGTVMRYLDFQPLRDRAFQSGREHILEGA